VLTTVAWLVWRVGVLNFIWISESKTAVDATVVVGNRWQVRGCDPPIFAPC